MADVGEEPLLEAEVLGDVVEAYDLDDLITSNAVVVSCPIRLAYEAEGATVDDVRAVVERDPNALMKPDSSGYLPVHWAAEELDNLAIFRYLVETCPDSLRVRTTGDEDPFLPIHLACLPIHLACLVLCEVSDHQIVFVAERVRIILEKWPEAAQERDVYGKYPMEYVDSGKKLPVARRIDEVWPQAINAAYDNGTFLLHKAIEFAGPSEEDELLEWVELLVSRRPTSVQEKDGEGHIALHTMMDTPANVVMFLMQKWKDSIKQRDRSGYIVLHYAVEQKWEDEDWRRVLDFHSQHWPESVHAKALDGSTPLSEAAESEMSLQGLRDLVDVWPESVRSTDNCGQLPIHRLFMRRRWRNPRLTPIAQFLIDRYPDSLFEKTDEGDVPLHILTKVTNDQPDHIKTELVELLVDAAPQSVTIQNNNGAIPLHDAIRNGFPLEGVQHLVHARPDPCQIRDVHGWTALHVAAAQAQLSPSLVRFLVRSCPESIRFRSNDGSTALHLVLARSSPPPDLITLLVEHLVAQDPKLLACADGRGRVPTHIAAAHNDSPEAMQCLIEKAPRWLIRPDGFGALALHTAVARRTVSMGVVRLLVESRPTTVACADFSGSLPLHVLLASGFATLEPVRFLVEHQPLGLSCLRESNSLGYVPLHVAALTGAPLDVLYYLVRRDPDMDYVRPASNKRKRISWHL